MRLASYKYLMIILVLLVTSILVVLIKNNYFSQESSAIAVPEIDQNAKIVADFWNRGVTIKNVPQKIVCLSPSIAEFICQIGHSEKIIGISNEITYLKSIASVEKVAYYDHIEINRILELKPDIIFASKYTYREICDIFTGHGIAIVYIEPNNYEEILKSLDLLGEIFEQTDEINQIKSNFESNIKEFCDNSSNIIKPNLLFVQNMNPLYVAGNNTFIDDIISLSGGNNIGNSGEGFYEVESEFINSNQIDMLVFSNKLKDEVSAQYIIDESIFKDSFAAKNENIVFVSNDELYINPTLEILKPIKEINSQIMIYEQKLTLENSNE